MCESVSFCNASSAFSRVCCFYLSSCAGSAHPHPRARRFFFLSLLSLAQYIAPRQEWIADVVTFRDEGGGVFREEKRRRTSEYLPVAKLAPVKASYVRAMDGWKVPVTQEGAVKPDKPVSRPTSYFSPFASGTQS